jgi:asparagine synthetase B (glutamine-hydrolysing)
MNEATTSIAVPYRMTSVEIACGWVNGGPSGSVSTDAVTARSPLEGLSDAIRPSLVRAPCLVEFSGGRDSSVVLAVACQVARQDGLPLPVPFTRRYPGLPEADEDEWQEMVIRHLGLTEWVHHSAVEEVDLLGSLAKSSLRKWGMLWPPLVHTRKAELDLARGGSLLSGEGGDEVLGPRRLGVLRHLMTRNIPMSRANARQVGLSLSPRPVRVERYRRRFDQNLELSWLRPDVRRAFSLRLAEDAAAESLDWRTAVCQHPVVRGVRLGYETLDILAADAGVARSNPLLSAEFLHTLCRAGGPLGFTDRTAALRSMFCDILPDAVLARSTKCRFNRAVFGEGSRAFVAGWTGEGVDGALVSADALKDVWMSEEPHAMSFPLLQSCWLAAHA